MVALRTMLLLTNSILFMIVGIILILRVKEAKGSLLLAKLSVVMATFSSAATFLTESISALNYQNESLVKQLYVVEDLFAMLVIAFLASFALFASYGGPGRNQIVALFFLMALIPPIYLTFTYNSAYIESIIEPEIFIFRAPPLTYILYAIFGIPLGLVPVIALGKSLISAWKRGDRLLGNRAATMLSAVVLNEAVYVLYVFGDLPVEIVALIAWIPALVFLMLAVLKITSTVEKV